MCPAAEPLLRQTGAVYRPGGSGKDASARFFIRILDHKNIQSNHHLMMSRSLKAR